MGKREDIRDAALDIIDEGGVRALTLSALFERAHTGAGTFYHYFDDREDLVKEIFLYCYDVAERELLDTDDPLASSRQRFNDLCRHMFHAYLTYPRELNFLYWYSFGYVEPDTDSCRVIPSIMLFTDIIGSLQQEGLIKKSVDPAIMARVVRGMVASVFWGHQHDMYPMDGVAVQRFTESVWRALEVF